MRGTTGLRAAIGVVVFGQGIAPADVVFHQGLDPSNPHFATSSTEGQGSISADNFGFVSDTTIAGLTWIGRVHGNDLLTVYDLEKVEGFTVEIHNSGIDGFGLPIPETLVYTEFFATASTNAVWTGIENPAKQFGSGRIYEHSVSLGEAFEATAGTAYFVSIRARMEDSLAGWGGVPAPGGWGPAAGAGDVLRGDRLAQHARPREPGPGVHAVDRPGSRDPGGRGVGRVGHAPSEAVRGDGAWSGRQLIMSQVRTAQAIRCAPMMSARTRR